MQTLVIEISNNKTLKLIEDLESLNLIKVVKDKHVKKHSKEKANPALSNTRNKKEREELLAKMNLLASQTKSTSFGDAQNYQRKIRVDKKLYNRD